MLGTPHRMEISGTREAWIYCFDGALIDEYVVAWFDQDALADTQFVHDLDFGACQHELDAFSFEQAPKAGG